MPEPELECLCFNADSGYRRKNHSWALARLYRTFSYCQPPEGQMGTQCRLAAKNDIERANLESIIKNPQDPVQKNGAVKSLNKLPESSAIISRGLRIRVLKYARLNQAWAASSVYRLGIIMAITQLAIAAVPVICYSEWSTFHITVAGKALAYAHGMLHPAKTFPRALRKPKRVIITEPDDSTEALLIICAPNDPDFEAMAAPQRDGAQYTWRTRLASLLLAML